jgi:hypothetical protein
VTISANVRTDMTSTAKRASAPQRRVLNDRGQSWSRASRLHHNTERKTHEVEEGILEVQKILLLKLARQENKEGLFTADPVTRDELERLRVDTALAIQATWSNGQHRSSLRQE